MNAERTEKVYPVIFVKLTQQLRTPSNNLEYYLDLASFNRHPGD
jgi:hypothetical protein